MVEYNRDFYKNRNTETVYSATKILDLVFKKIPIVNTVADLGCGVGTWLSVCKKMGVKNIFGYDGDWVDEDLLDIDKNSFHKVDLSNINIKHNSKLDLAISLEVAEHLPENTADKFISELTELSDYVLFSAAIPNQGGIGHVNEQWQSYWVNKFKLQGYICNDIIRGEIWSDDKISFWYRQNIFLFIKESSKNKNSSCTGPLDIVHPNLSRQPQGIKKDFKSLYSSIYNSFKSRLNA